MRIVINKDHIIEKVSCLCEEGQSPTQLIIDLINQAYAQKGCKEDDKEETHNKDSLHRPLNR